MSPTPSSSHVAIAPINNNVLMDINPKADPKAVCVKQEAQDVEKILQQAQEKVTLVNEGQEKCWEEWKRLEEKAQLVMMMRSVAGEVTEVAVARERRMILQVIFRLFSSAFVLELTGFGQEDLDVSVMTQEPLLAPWKDKGPEVSFRIHWSFILELILEQVMATTNGDQICDQ